AGAQPDPRGARLLVLPAVQPGPVRDLAREVVERDRLPRHPDPQRPRARRAVAVRPERLRLYRLRVPDEHHPGAHRPLTTGDLHVPMRSYPFAAFLGLCACAAPAAPAPVERLVTTTYGELFVRQGGRIARRRRRPPGSSAR